MVSGNLLVKQLYASIPQTNVINDLFVMGLEQNNDRLAVSAMEELILRGDTDLVMNGLSNAFKNHQVKIGTTMSAMIARSLTEADRKVDPILPRFGKFLYKAETDDPVKEMLTKESKEQYAERKNGKPASEWMRDCIK